MPTTMFRSRFFGGVCALAVALTACSSSSGASGGDACASDSYESNDSPGSATDLGAFSDSPNSTKSIDLTISSAGDVDWFTFNVRDRGLGGDPEITISAPEGYDVTSWFTCSIGSIQTLECLSGKRVEGDDPDNEGLGCKNIPPSGAVSSTTDCSGTDEDDGLVFVRIRHLEKARSCVSYNVTIEVK